MPPTAEIYSRFREPISEFESDFVSEQEVPVQHFPTKNADDGEHYASSRGRSEHYADTEPRSRHTSHSRTTSSAKRSRKTSTSTARELVRALIHERLETDASIEAQLARAYDIIREENRRAIDAERAAIETAERMKGLALSRATAQKDAARAEMELRAYKLQLENARLQLEEANSIAASSDAERIRAEQTVGKLKRAVQKFRLDEAMRRAKEEGRREGRYETIYGVPPHTRSSPRTPVVVDEDEEDRLRTPVSNVPIPIPPPDVMPIMSRRTATPTLRRSQTPVQSRLDRQMTPVPEVIRQRTTPPSRGPQTPYRLPVPPPASIPVLSRRSETPSRPSVYDEFDPVPETLNSMHINPVPDHIIVRSPVPVRPRSETPKPVNPPRPPSSQAIHPGYASHAPHRMQDQRHTRHHSLDDPAARASASASRIYSNYSTSTSESSGSEPPRPPSRNIRRVDDLPRQETIIPRPAPSGSNGRISGPARPPSAASSLAASAADFARQQRRRPVSVSSSSTSSHSSPRAFPTPSRVAQLKRLPLGDRNWSGETGSSIPGITIEPPSRPESVDSLATGVTHPSHISPFIQERPLPQGSQVPSWGMPPQSQPQPHPQHQMPPQRPASRTGFMYGPPSPGSGPQISAGFGMGGVAVPVPASPNGGGMGFVSPPSPVMGPGMNFGGAQPVVPPMPHMQYSARRMSVSGAPPPSPGSAADYFAGNHHHSISANGHGRHRREPAGMGASVETLNIDPNAFHDPDTDPSVDDEADGFGGDRAPTPRANPNPYAFDERRAGFDDRRGGGDHGSMHSRNGTPTSGTGFIPPRPPSSAASREDFGFNSPRGVPLPTSASTSAYASRAASAVHGGGNGNGSANGSKGTRNRNVSLMSGGKGNRPMSRNAFGNTPFVRSSGLDDS